MAQQKSQEELIAELQKQLADSVAARDAAVQAANEAAAAAAAAEAQAEALKKASATGTVVINGEYKGYRFADGHKNVRNRAGELCDTEKLIAAANDSAHEAHAEATSTLDWLIDIQYGYIKAVEA